MTHEVLRYLMCLNVYDGDIGVTLGAISGGSTPASSTYPVASDALYVPVIVNQTVWIKRLFALNGSVVSGNIDMAVYAQDGTRITASVATTQTGTGAPQFFDITDRMLSPGRYYIAVVCDNTTATLHRANLPATTCQAIGMAKQASAYPLPATATFASCTAGFLPMIGAEIADLR